MRSAYIITGFYGPAAAGARCCSSPVTPSFHWRHQLFVAVLATIGTTITPWGCVYLQASVADKGVKIEALCLHPSRRDHRRGAGQRRLGLYHHLHRGHALSARHPGGDRRSRRRVALEPLAGRWRALPLFGIGLLGASLLAASVLPLSTTYAVCEAFGWERGAGSLTVKRSADLFWAIYGR